MTPPALIHRRGLLIGAASLLASPVLAARPETLAFEVWRRKRRIGSHSLSFQGDGDDFTVAITAVMQVKIGPVTVFRYRHEAMEIWRGGRFAELRSRTVSNGKVERVEALRQDGGVRIATAAGERLLPPDAQPLTHWNPRTLTQPLFNPQTGAAIRKAVVRRPGQRVALADAREIPATAYVLTGDAQITNWYDAEGIWSALQGKVEDGSLIDYRRVA